MTNLVLERCRNEKLYITEYEEVVKMASTLFNMSEKKEEKLRENIISQIIIKLPFLAKSNNPKRTALSNIIITYAASHNSCKQAFLHNISDNSDLFNRLECINNFDGGDEKVIKSGMSLLAILMLADYQKDRFLDQKNNKYNPIGRTIWDYNDLIHKLENDIIKYNCPEMNSLPDMEDVKYGFWEFP